MTPDQKFARRVQAAIVLFILLFAYFLAADLWMPITPQAQLTRPVLRIAPRVDGQVLDVAVANNQHVAAGQLLFRLDPEPFHLAVRAAELELEQAGQDNLQLDAAIAAAQADRTAAQASANELQRESARLGRLVQSQHVSRQLFEQTEAERQAAQARLSAAGARVRELTAQRGTQGDDNLRLRQARNALERARLQLQYSEVRAERAGTLSNLQLSAGAFLHAGNPVAALVADETDISADFREKALRYVRLEDEASVVFDALPGHIFAARVSALDAGVKEGQLDANGDLAAPTISDRWVRDAQRQRLHVSLSEPLTYNLPSGAKATVQLYPHDSQLADLFGRLQIQLISLLHYVY
ncbi:HlyD family secretion protein [Pseudomonas sp. Gutcm_11s]|uniref:HlyD family secretion protein n=1 Tax=Pseudomonas sp. Gutcm_11s TaxID=3026088 RepID=UPI002361F9EE|nr:HlyD family secretion protein [Pseudomonas sp. Gutcm_11s]MDD0841959.1 HlyD family secretion protein [Pseudomonas sp. Gutcm_11s]